MKKQRTTGGRSELNAAEDREAGASACLDELDDLGVEKNVKVGPAESRMNIGCRGTGALPILDTIRHPACSTTSLLGRVWTGRRVKGYALTPMVLPEFTSWLYAKSPPSSLEAARTLASVGRLKPGRDRARGPEVP